MKVRLSLAIYLDFVTPLVSYFLSALVDYNEAN